MESAAEAKLPRRVGRYDVVGMLATGGMAEILLGRQNGPRGFERPVVIKRILPHLARDKAFVHMFLDEAHIAAGVRHPNVVQVHELGQEEDDLYLVMEYLEGEPAASLLRRATARGLRLDPELCAYLVAEACSGLHAAHELKGAGGELRNIVHRDVSPQNIFVTYDGTVKVLDFGIAKAADRITHTEAGQLKGKFHYMSPEQCRGEPLDRRSDTFSLGIVLYELLTGRWLFRRATQAATIRAVLEHEIVPPSELAPGLPEALDGICMRALHRSRRRRYATAADMRRDLLEVVRPTRDGAMPEERLAALMGQMFTDRMDEKAELIRRVRSGEPVRELPATVADAEIDVPEAPAEVDGTGSVTARGPRRRSVGGWGAAVGGAVLALVLVGGGLAWSSLRAEGEGAASVEAVRAAGTPSERADPVHAPQQTEEAPVVAQVGIRVESTPPGARVHVDGEERGETPLEIHLERGDEPVPLRLELAGYRDVRESVVPDVDQRLRLSLVRERVPRRRRPRSRATMSAPAGDGDPPATMRRFDLWE